VLLWLKLEPVTENATVVLIAPPAPPTAVLLLNVEPSMVTATVVSIAPPAAPAVLALNVLLRTVNTPSL
jgi:hypothetical protein